MKKFTSILLVIAAVFMSFQVQAQEQTGTANKNDETVYKQVEQMPSYPGGNAALLQDVSNNLQWPEDACCTQGRVVVQFVITKDGSLGTIKVVRSLSPEFDQAAINAVKRLKKFNPGRQNGKPVNVWYTMPITFRMQTGEEN